VTTHIPSVSTQVFCITGWALDLTCYISRSVERRKMADFDPSGSHNPWTDFDETWHGWLRPGPHATWQLFGGSATWAVWANIRFVTSLSFFSFFFLSCLFCFLQHAPRWRFLTNPDDLCAKTRVSSHECAFCSLDDIQLHL